MTGYNDNKELEYRIHEFRNNLLNEYSQYVDKDILNLYLPNEKSIVVNDDDDMYPLDLVLPEPPEIHKIDGFGLPPEKQFFRRPTLPSKLVDLIKSTKTVVELIEKMENNRRLYYDEILWIQKQWYCRLNGYWFFNNGIPTYIDGWNYFYLVAWHLDIGLPTYRYRDRIFFLFARYCYTVTEASFFYRVYNDNISDYYYFSDYKKADIYIGNNALLVTPEKGLWTIDYGRRVCYGFNYPKHRREGATYRGCCINYAITSMTQDVHSVVMSKDGESAGRTFIDKIVRPVKKIPFYFKPNIANKLTNSSTILDFDLTTEKANSVIFKTGLASSIHPMTAVDERKEDGNKYIFVHGDEVGKNNKARPYNLTLRHDIMKKTIAQYPIINGMMVNTSTSDDTKEEAGRRYMELCHKSHTHQRDYITGLTESGLFNLFMPAYINLDGCSDMFGNPIISNPTIEQQRYSGFKFGAKDLIESQLQQCIDDPETYYNTMREFPTKFRHCFMSSGEESGFDLMALVDRINILDMNANLKPRIGNFEWVNGFGSNVEFYDKPDGKFHLSYYPDTANNIIRKNGKLYPANTDKFIAGCDPFRFDDTRKKRHSDNAGAVYMKRDYMIDPEGKPVKDMETDRFVCTYSNPTKEHEFKEDMLKMTLFFGCEMYPEMNEEMVYKYLRDSKYNNFLGYLYVDGKRSEFAGVYTQVRSKQLMFKLWKQKIERACANERHRELLQELADIEGLKDMVNYDLFASSAICLVANYYAKKDIKTDDNGIGDSTLLDWVQKMQRHD